MPGTIDYFKKKYDQVYERSSPVEFALFNAAAQVFKSYQKNSQANFREPAKVIERILSYMSLNLDDFRDKIESQEQPLYHFFVFAMLQTSRLKLLAPDIEIFADTISHWVSSVEVKFTAEQREELQKAIAVELNSDSDSDVDPRNSLSLELQKNIVGTMISQFINQSDLRQGKSAFASACYVVAKELRLTNIALSVWKKMIDAADIPGHFLGKNSSQRRAAEMEQIKKRSQRERSPTYSRYARAGESMLNQSSLREIPSPDYQEHQEHSAGGENDSIDDEDPSSPPHIP